jgi:phosphatidylserine/phosphatidylglycerophosphate/cardiolipin synthase-like enzyme
MNELLPPTFHALSLAYAGDHHSMMFALSAADVEQYFSHRDDLRLEVSAVILASCNSLDIQMYTYCDESLADAAIAAHERGVVVRIMLDRMQVFQKSSQARKLVAAGMNVRISKNTAIFHDKLAIVDGRVVLTGSFNWTIGAETRNEENLCRIESSEVAARAEDQFNVLWELWNPELTAELSEPLPVKE